jgi:hypothetical protein
MRITLPVLLFAGVVLAACSPPQPPDEERRPEPQSAGAARQPQSAIVQTAEAYKDRARSADAQQQAKEDAQRAEIDAATR